MHSKTLIKITENQFEEMSAKGLFNTAMHNAMQTCEDVMNRERHDNDSVTAKKNRELIEAAVEALTKKYLKNPEMIVKHFANGIQSQFHVEFLKLSSTH